jgi:hypothetical protein
MGEWRYNSIILDLDTRRNECSASRLDRFIPLETVPVTHLMDGPQNRSGSYGEVKNLLHLPGIEPARPAL